MKIFNSLGSNYDLSFAFKVLFSSSKKQYPKNLASFLAKKYSGQATLTYKGRQALTVVLKQLKLNTGAVAINGFTCLAVYQGIKVAGLDTVYIDIDPQKLHFSAKSLKATLNKNPQVKAVVIQNTLGFPADIEKIATVCKKHKVALIEDLAHSVGTKYESGKQAGRIGEAAFLSFSQDKIVDSVSGGAAILKCTKSDQRITSQKVGWYQKIKDWLYPMLTFIVRTSYSIGIGKLIHFVLKTLRVLSQPMAGSQEPQELPRWHANLALQQFKNHQQSLDHRRQIATIYAKELNSKLLIKGLVKLIDRSANIRFPILVKNRDQLIKHLKNHGVFVSDIWYDAPVAPKRMTSQSSYRNECPKAKKVADKMLNLPTHKNVSPDQAIQISNIINQWLKSN